MLKDDVNNDDPRQKFKEIKLVRTAIALGLTSWNEQNVEEMLNYFSTEEEVRTFLQPGNNTFNKERSLNYISANGCCCCWCCCCCCC